MTVGGLREVEASRKPGAMVDPNALFQRATTAFAAGRYEAARSDLLSLVRSMPAAAQTWHLLALVERRRGDVTGADKAFAAALELAPNDAALLGNYANLLAASGRLDAAIDHYRRAVAIKPDFTDAWLNLGIAAQDFHPALAIEALRRAVRLAPVNAKAWSALGLVLRARGEHDSAAEAFDRAIAIAPDHATATTGRAMVEMERGGPRTLALLDRARTLSPNDRDLIVIAAQVAGDEARLDTLVDAVRADPAWVAGQVELAKLRWEAGASCEEAMAYIDAALRTRPADAALWQARLQLARQVGDPRVGVLLDQARRSLGDLAMIAQLEAEQLLERGEVEAAEAALDRAPAAEQVLTRARIRLRAREPDGAAMLLETHLAEAPDDQLGWALLATAWRMAAHPRLDWLLGPDMWSRQPLDLPSGDLVRIADHVRSLHVARQAPPDQSLRGGTQTRGALLLRTSPEIVQLRRGIEAVIGRFIARLPPHREGHPLLGRRREGWRFSGSWSVRLTGGGFHVAHVHPRGWLSSACYLALPVGLDAGAAEGALVLGEPPAELATGLPPLALIEPQVGHLALFPSFLWHGTRPFEAGERMSVAFDVSAA